jgi:hypothetical protein
VTHHGAHNGPIMGSMLGPNTEAHNGAHNGTHNVASNEAHKWAPNEAHAAQKRPMGTSPHELVGPWAPFQWAHGPMSPHGSMSAQTALCVASPIRARGQMRSNTACIGRKPDCVLDAIRGPLTEPRIVAHTYIYIYVYIYIYIFISSQYGSLQKQPTTTN